MEIEPTLMMFTEIALAAFPIDDTVEHNCPHCGEKVRYPIVARQGDIEHLQSIIQLASEWLDEKGVTERMMKEILEKLKKKIPEIQAERILKDMGFGD